MMSVVAQGPLHLRKEEFEGHCPGPVSRPRGTDPRTELAAEQEHGRTQAALGRCQGNLPLFDMLKFSRKATSRFVWRQESDVAGQPQTPMSQSTRQCEPKGGKEALPVQQSQPSWHQSRLWEAETNLNR